jgi:hypothetical protein
MGEILTALTMPSTAAAGEPRNGTTFEREGDAPEEEPVRHAQERESHARSPSPRRGSPAAVRAHSRPSRRGRAERSASACARGPGGSMRASESRCARRPAPGTRPGQHQERSPTTAPSTRRRRAQRVLDEHLAHLVKAVTARRRRGQGEIPRAPTHASSRRVSARAFSRCAGRCSDELSGLLREARG